MDAVVAGGLFGVGGVVIGAVLSDVSAKRGRREAHGEQRDDERLARELAIAERLDEALFSATRLVERATDAVLSKAVHEAHDAWVDAWVAFSPRLRAWPLVERYTVVGNVLLMYDGIGRPLDDEDRTVVVRAIRDARWALAYFMRGDDTEPENTFPGEDELRRLIERGKGKPDPAELLKVWVAENEVPLFRPPERD